MCLSKPPFVLLFVCGQDKSKVANEFHHNFLNRQIKEQGGK